MHAKHLFEGRYRTLNEQNDRGREEMEENSDQDVSYHGTWHHKNALLAI